MCEVMDRIYNWGEQIGEQRSQRETTRNLFKMGMPIDQIALAVNASKQAVQEWLKTE